MASCLYCNRIITVLYLCEWLTVQELREKLSNVQCEVQTAMQDPSICLAFLRPGRLIRVKEGQVGWNQHRFSGDRQKHPQYGISAASMLTSKLHHSYAVGVLLSFWYSSLMFMHMFMHTVCCALVDQPLCRMIGAGVWWSAC